MSMLMDAMEDCVLYRYSRERNPEGGFNVVWEEDIEFKAAISFDNSVQARIAEKQGVSSLYSVYTDKNIMLMYHDVFKRLSDGKILRVTSDGDDKKTPEIATFQVRKVLAEEWELTNDN